MYCQKVQNLIQLQTNTQNIRNISIIAHVDHGKTTLVDCLLASNNVVNRKQVGSIRFCDSREDERERLITMKSSSFSLNYFQQQTQYLINLIDSPGHIAFRSEVSYALRLTDGALLLVDVVEGVSSQTYTVLKQAFDEKIKCILVLNKMDRLIQELKLNPQEAYTQLRQTIDLVNAYISSLIMASKTENIAEMEEQLFFFPEKGNVLFTSAMHCWGFSLQTFLDFYKTKNQNFTISHLWGDYFEHPKTKIIQTTPLNSKDMPLFVKYILKTIWQVYETIESGDLERYDKVCTVLNLKLTPNDKKDFERRLGTVYGATLNAWIPIEVSIFDTACKLLPDPIQAQKIRYPIICKKLIKFPILKLAVETCDQSEQAPVIIFISKMISIDKRNINDLDSLENQNSEHLIGYARIFSGTLQRGQKIYIITHKKEKMELKEIIIRNIYLVMGQNMEGVQKVPAGNIVGIAGLDEYVFKTATLSTNPQCPQFTQMQLGAQQLLKVNITAQNIQDIHKLNEGFKKLNQSDPSISVICEKNGEYQLATCGELHLERCINDLEKTFAKVKVVVSDPILQFKETVNYKSINTINNLKNFQKKIFTIEVYIQKQEDSQNEIIQKKKQEEISIEGFQIFYGKNNACHVKDIKQKQNQISILLPNGCFSMTVTCVGFDMEFANYLEKNPQKHMNDQLIKKMEEFSLNKEILQLIKTSFICFGPNKSGPNILIIKNVDHNIINLQYLSKQEIEQAFICGFEQVIQNGPLSYEPLMGVCYILDEFNLVEAQNYDVNQDSFGSLSGQIMSTFFSACHETFLGAEPRLVEGLLNIQAQSSFIGHVYGVLNKRKACNIDESLNEFSNMFVIKGDLPLAESLGFDEEIRSATQSKAEYQLSFKKWQTLQYDPFYTPQSKEVIIIKQELEEQGEKVDENRAKLIIDNIRTRKAFYQYQGLQINKKIVEDGHKNRTIKKNK